MDINVSQVSQNFGSEIVDISAHNTLNKDSSGENLAAVKQQTKDLSISAEKDKQSIDNVSAEQLAFAVSKLSEFVQISNRQLNFSVDEGSNKLVVKVTDVESGEVIRQIPSEEVLKLSERLQELQTEVGTAVGLLFNKHV
jgi:flagellar protein FlaG